MRIAIDNYWRFRGQQSLRVVSSEIVDTWASLYPDDQLFVQFRRSETVQRADFPSNVTPWPTVLRPHGLSVAAQLGMRARAAGADAVVSHNFAPLTGPPRFTILHDALFVEHPEWFTTVERAYFRTMRAAIRLSRPVLLATSLTEGARIERLLKVHVAGTIGLGVSTELREAHPEQVAGLLREGERFVLAVGRLNIRKNLAFAIRSFALTRARSDGLVLLVVGQPDGRSERLDNNLGDYVRATGYVEPGNLKWLYQNCEAFICLSRDEGFGMPILEAASFGKPVVASDIEVFRDVLTGYRRFFPAPLSDEQACADVIDLALAAPRESPGCSAEAISYGWEPTVRALRNQISIRLRGDHC